MSIDSQHEAELNSFNKTINTYPPVEGDPRLDDLYEEEPGKQNRLRAFIETKAGKAAVAGAGLLAAGGLMFGGMKMSEGSGSAPETPPAPVGNGQEVVVPTDAQQFISAYESRYSDPLAVYYAEEAYETQNPGSPLTIGDDYISSYNFESVGVGEKSPLGFDTLRLPYDTEVNVDTSVNQFNTARPAMNLLINLLAKNPTPEQIAVITDEFNKYTGFGFEDEASNLVTFFNGVIAKHGSESNYTINEASTTNTDPETATIFDAASNTVIDSVNEEGVVQYFHNSIELSISIDSYDAANNKTSTTDVTSGFDFRVGRAPGEIDPLQGAFVGIGTIDSIK